MTPKHQAIAYLIWAECQQNGWDRTIGDVAEAVGVTAQLAGLVIKAKGWRNRFRATEKNSYDITRHGSMATHSVLRRDQLIYYGVNI